MSRPDIQDVIARAIIEWRAGRTIEEMREVNGVTVDVDRYVVQITPQPLKPEAGLTVNVIVTADGQFIDARTFPLTDA